MIWDPSLLAWALFWAAIGLATLLLIQPAVAQEKSSAKPPAKTTAKPATKAAPKNKANLMTRDNRLCIACLYCLARKPIPATRVRHWQA